MLTQNPPAGITNISVEENNLLRWIFTVLGPEGTPYHGGRYVCSAVLPDNYPMVPPTVTVLTEIFSPNVDQGKLCEELFKKEWGPNLSMAHVMQLLLTVFTDFSRAPICEEAALLWGSNRAAFEARVQEMTRKQASV